ncbi:N-acetylneuraminate synthase family protein [Deltaproteobacteria bacterium TL4]
MIIDKNLSKFIIYYEESILNALIKIENNEEQCIFAVTQSGELEGVLTDGDFRRWLINPRIANHSLEQSVRCLVNKNFQFARDKDNPDKIRAIFSERISLVPILNEHQRLVAIAKKRTKRLEIDSFRLDDASPTFIVAEIGNNHNGDFELAKKLVEKAKESGAHCAKFQMRNLKSLYKNEGETKDIQEDLGSQYTLDLLTRFQLPNDQLFQLFDYCRQLALIPLCTPWDMESFLQLENYGMPAYKVASADFTNHELLEGLARSGKPLICSTGMTTENEIVDSVKLLRNLGAQYVLLHCNSTYPAPFKDIQLQYMNRLKVLGDCFVGYSGHERGINVVLAAVGLGAKVIEKHFTLDKTMEGNDHRVSLLPEEFKQMVEGIREIESAMGQAQIKTISQGELINRETLGKSLVINCELKEGQVILESMIHIKSPGKGLPPYLKKDLIGKIAKRNFKAGDFFYRTDLENTEVSHRNFQFSRPWGLPVRYHDMDQIQSMTNVSLLEFHLSYSDLEEELLSHFSTAFDLDFVVHSPELFAGDHTLNLCTFDNDYRQRSVHELQRVIDITKAIKPFFKRATRPLIIVNVGGFTEDEALPPSERKPYYDQLSRSLSELKTEGVELIPQTMPPFPWLFGGQRFHNLFMDPDEIARFCKKHHSRICLDISHSKLACSYFKWSFDEFVEKVGPHTAHLHIVDAKGVDGEGLQIGEGEIDFYSLSKTLKKTTPESSFIPEIWQGHKNNGEGFWIALDRLEHFNI